MARYLLGGLFLWGTWLSCVQPKPEDRPPNFVLIMADDLGYAGIGCYGNEVIHTAHLDRMATEGLRFTDYHSNGSVCSPTRAAMLTGRYQQRSGLEGVIYARGPTRATGLDTNEHTVASLLKAEGYATAIIGKWHLGYQKRFNPTHCGFDEFRGYVSGNVDFHTHYDNAGVYDWWHDTDTVIEEGYVTDLITQHSVEFIQRHKNQPFFLYVPHEAPHVPFQGRNDPGYRFADNEFTYHGPVQDQDRAYIEMVEVMDEGIGKIMETLESEGLAENTLVFFVSDNGGEPFGHNGPLRDDKGSLFEGGHRVPAIAWWKGQVEPGISDATVMSFDLMPTFLALADVGWPEGHPLDGIDLSSHILQGAPLSPRTLFWRYRESKAVRSGPFKLMTIANDTMLFDLTTDLAEQSDISSSHPGERTQLLNELAAWEQEMNAVTQKTR